MLGKYFFKLRTLYKKHRFELMVQKIYKVSKEKKKSEKSKYWIIRFKPLL